MEQQYAALQPSSKATTEPVRSFSTNSRPACGRPPAAAVLDRHHTAPPRNRPHPPTERWAGSTVAMMATWMSGTEMLLIVDQLKDCPCPAPGHAVSLAVADGPC